MSDSNWPPKSEDILMIAKSAFAQSDKDDIKVLVYWDNPKLMIFDPCHYAHTEYVHKKYKSNDRIVTVSIGKQD